MYSTGIKIYDRTRSESDNMNFDEACTAFFNWKDAVAESAEEYSERIRKLKLLKTFKSIIKNELTAEQRNMLKLKYLDGKSGEEIAAVYGISRSTVCRNLMKITEIFEVRMKYVFEYADTDIRNEDVPAYIEKAIAMMAADAGKTDSIGERLKKARTKKLLSVSLVSQVTGVPQKRIENFEQGGNISVSEFVKLISLYKLSADQAVFGA